MENIYNSAIVNRETYVNITKRIQTLKTLIDSREKVQNFINQDIVRKKDYLDNMALDLLKTTLYGSTQRLKATLLKLIYQNIRLSYPLKKTSMNVL